MPRPGPRAKIDPAFLVDLIDEFSEHVTGGHPVRTRHYINGTPVSQTDARMIRRWRTGQIVRVTERSAAALLRRYDITTNHLEDLYS